MVSASKVVEFATDGDSIRKKQKPVTEDTDALIASMHCIDLPELGGLRVCAPTKAAAESSAADCRKNYGKDRKKTFRVK